MPSHNTLSSGVFSHLLFRLLSKFPRKQFSFFLSDVRTRTLVSTASKQSKEGRHPLSLSSPHTDHRRIARVHRVKTQPNRPSFSYPSKVHFLSEPIGRTVSFSLSLTLSVPSISLFLCIEVFSKDELQLSHQSVMGGQPVSRRGREKFLFFNSQQPHHRKMSFGFPRPSWNRPFRIEFVFLRLHSLVFVKLQSHGAKLARAKPRFKL